MAGRGGRNDAAIAAALHAVAQAVGQPQVVGAGVNDGVRMQETFLRNHPPTFKGRYDPDGAQSWLKEIERIFRVMDCSEAQMVRFGTHMLADEADDWWVGIRPILEVGEEVITWAVFKREFLNKYFPEDVRGKKEIEFLELKQGDMSVTEYAAKFVELAKFYPHYSADTAEFSKCIKFENGLRPEIKRAIGYQKIREFSDLVSSCRIYEADTKAHYKIMNERKSRSQPSRGKPYSTPADKGKSRVNDERKSVRKAVPNEVVCFNCGEKGHKSNVCDVDAKRCFRCGRKGHMQTECKHSDAVCFNCKEEGHIGSQCTKPKRAQSGGKVFALAGTQTASEDRLIRGTCFINHIPLITIIDTGATHCFVAADCVSRLGLKLSSRNGEMVIETPAKGSVTTSLVCSRCPLSMFGEVELVTTKQLKRLALEGNQLFSLMASLSIENQAVIDKLPVVCEFPEVFPDEIPEVPPEREVEFSIDLVPGTKPVSMAPYLSKNKIGIRIF
ncbi:unnamed protein product [Trifolium pratense]|uniref:Uncharacterized protein n=1 Tax=Trifolium pratense TaxID=57577 RepID=A0ACB0JFX4_TRIPR|nr:unnamed protein product [Trifolium pratense]